ncbi:hypothetical protein [Microbacterium sp. SS28]|uniref:hypothetical protein n=1 Tax=Microbacterium sp. SS28 TaxID=2919948 RepID=UPI001FA9BA1B|nr:hypothetical protein [Microbacterium sp. SS28]
MGKGGNEVGDPESRFAGVMVAAAKMPGVRINRAAYLSKALARYCSEEQISVAIEQSPAAAGISLEVLGKAADDSIRWETSKVTTLSTATGMPGGWAVVATIPADITQYFAHVIRIAQKLAYLYSWPDLFSDDNEEPDDATMGILTIFIGVMFGASAANAGLAKIADLLSKQALKKLPQMALTKGAIYPIVKTVAGYLGIRMTKQIFAGGVAKILPVLGGVASGALTLATFLPMSMRLKKHLASLELTKPSEPGDATVHDVVVLHTVDTDPEADEPAA